METVHLFSLLTCNWSANLWYLPSCQHAVKSVLRAGEWLTLQTSNCQSLHSVCHEGLTLNQRSVLLHNQNKRLYEQLIKAGLRTKPIIATIYYLLLQQLNWQQTDNCTLFSLYDQKIDRAIKCLWSYDPLTICSTYQIIRLLLPRVRWKNDTTVLSVRST